MVNKLKKGDFSEATNEVALFLDWENIKKAIDKVPDVHAIKKAAMEFGRITVARAYANWQDGQHDKDCQYLYDQGIEPVFVLTYRNSTGLIKNSADVRISVECTEQALSNKNIKTLVLVSGDKDFIHVINLIKSIGKRVVVIAATGSFSPEMRYLADKFIIYDNLVGGFINLKDLDLNEKIKETLKILKEVVEEVRSNPERDNGAHTLKTLICSRIVDFEEEDLGFSSFDKFLLRGEWEGIVRMDTTIQPPQVYLGEEKSNKEGGPLFGKKEWTTIIKWLKEQQGRRKINWNDLETFFLNTKEITQECPEIPSKQFAKILLANNILNRHYTTGLDAKTGKTFPITNFTLNQFDSRVQVYLGMSG